MGRLLIGQTNNKILTNKLQKTLRNEMTEAEQALWQVLRGRQIVNLKFRRQHPFGDYILDFVCLEIRLIIEVDGGQHGNQAEYDEVRSEQLRIAGFHVLRFWNNEVLLEMEAVKEQIWMTVRELLPHPHPSPPFRPFGSLKGRGLR